MKLLYVRIISHGRHPIYIYRFFCLKINVVHWLNPNCTLLPTQFETISYICDIWSQMLRNRLISASGREDYTHPRFAPHLARRPSLVLRFGPPLKQVADPWPSG